MPISKAITRVLLHEDVPSHCLNTEVSRNDDRIGIYYDSKNFKQSKLFNSPENCKEMILYQDNFNAVNPLGNMVSKLKCQLSILSMFQTNFVHC